jgi:hypothetical protein
MFEQINQEISFFYFTGYTARIGRFESLFLEINKILLFFDKILLKKETWFERDNKTD